MSTHDIFLFNSFKGKKMAKMHLGIENTDRRKVPEKAQKIRDEMWNRL